MNCDKLKKYLEIPLSLADSDLDKIVFDEGIKYVMKTEYVQEIYESLSETDKLDREGRYLLAILGELHFQAENYHKARYHYNLVMNFDRSIGNPFLHLRLGQIHYYLGNTDRMHNELSRALIMGGERVFKGGEEEFLKIPKKILKRPFLKSWENYDGQDWEITKN